MSGFGHRVHAAGQRFLRRRAECKVGGDRDDEASEHDSGHRTHDRPHVEDTGDLLARAQAMVQPQLRRLVCGTLPDPLRLMAGYHFGWWDREGTVTAAMSGKALRPALALATARACAGSTELAVGVATAVELLHNFTLIHDDVMDRDLLRRGRPTVWSQWGPTNAILLGDALHALAFHAIITDGSPAAAQARSVQWLTGVAVELCHGQQLDCEFETRTDVDVQDYLTVAMGKTGALMGGACALGALSAGANLRTVAQMDAFGRQLGLAFQFADDVMGIWGDPATTGKPAGADLMRRKKTLPVLTALQTPSTAAALRAYYASTAPLSDAELAHLMGLLDQSQIRQVTLGRAQQRVSQALSRLSSGPETTELRALAHLVAHRKR